MTFAHLIATGTPHPLAESLVLDRFDRLEFILETGTTVSV